MTKPSEVLRLAAEKSFLNPPNWLPLNSASRELGQPPDEYGNTVRYAQMMGYGLALKNKDVPMALCLAAAIAESEGD